MGFSSRLCLGCGRPLLDEGLADGVRYWMWFGVAISSRLRVKRGVFSGYSYLLGNDEDFPEDFEEQLDIEPRDSVLHEACWVALGRPGYLGPSKGDPNQGYVEPDEHLVRAPGPRGWTGDDSRYPTARLHRAAVRALAAKYYPASRPLQMVRYEKRVGPEEWDVEVTNRWEQRR